MSDDTQIQTSSRSGRVRKKNSFLADFESLDDYVETSGRKRKSKSAPKKASPKTSSAVRWSTKAEEPQQQYVGTHQLDLLSAEDVGMGDLEMDLPDDFNDADMPTLVAAEEIVDSSLQYMEDGGLEMEPLSANTTPVNRLKSQAQSTYMLEKQLESAQKPVKGRRSFEDVTRPVAVVTPTASAKAKPSKTVGRADKAKPAARRITGYTLWAKEQKINFPHLDLGSSKSLAAQWNAVPQAQKRMWRSRAAKQMKVSGENIKTTGKKRGRARKVPLDGSTGETPAAGKPAMVKVSGKPVGRKRKTMNSFEDYEDVTPPPKKLQQLDGLMPGASPTKGKGKGKAKGKDGSPLSNKSSPQEFVMKNGRKSPARGAEEILNVAAMRATASPGKSGSTKLQYSPRREDDTYKVTRTDPNDAAAHFILLGESLQIIGQRLQENEVQGELSGSLSVLLDSLICSIGPLLCLTQQVKELNVIPKETLAKTMNNIGYIMPGL